MTKLPNVVLPAGPLLLGRARLSRAWYSRPLTAPTAYVMAAAIGLLTVAWLLPAAAVGGVGPFWSSPPADTAQSLAGHLAYQWDRWRLPPFVAGNLMWPHGASVALTDSNPLVSLVAKTWETLTGGAPVNLLGGWLACCWLLQAPAAVFALRGLGGGGLAATAAAAVLAEFDPALLARNFHINLCGHFLLLAAFGLAARQMRAPTAGVLAGSAACLLLSILVHPYLYMLAAALLAAPVLQAAITRRGLAGAAAGFLASAFAPLLVFWLCNGALGGGEHGFTTYSMNLLSPVWPGRSGLLGDRVAPLDATGGQYEGYNYLGAGSLLLVAASLVTTLRDGPPAALWARWSGLVVILVLLAVFSLSSRIYFGHTLVLDLGEQPWESLFSVFRAPGRAFWPVGYGVILAAIIAVEGTRPAPVILLAAILLQGIDTLPLQRSLQHHFATAAADDPMPSFADVRLLTIVPLGCTTDPDSIRLGPELLAAAARHPVAFTTIGMARMPRWFNCERMIGDGMEHRLRPGELRVITSPALARSLHLAALGPDAHCERRGAMELCRTGPPAAATPDNALPTLDPATPLRGRALATLLSRNWTAADAAGAYSEGPHASLLFSVPPRQPADLVLQLAGVASHAGGERPLTVTLDDATTTVSLPDGAVTTLTVPVPGDDTTMRLAFDIDHPVDPARRGLTWPVHRAGIRLLSIALEPRR